jgi:hypothetical protein
MDLAAQPLPHRLHDEVGMHDVAEADESGQPTLAIAVRAPVNHSKQLGGVTVWLRQPIPADDHGHDHCDGYRSSQGQQYDVHLGSFHLRALV